MKLHNRKPDITELHKVLRREKPTRPVLFELFLNGPLYERLAGRKCAETGDRDFEYLRLVVEAFAAAGFDYATTSGSAFGFPTGDKGHGAATISLNQGFVITDEETFENYAWQDPENFDYSRLEKIKPHLPDGMKLMVMGPSGVLENTINLVGYDNLCVMLYDKPELAKRIFDAVGSRLLKYYEISAQYDSVGLIMSNDDWGFKTQTFLTPEQMREYVFPWHKKIVAAAHAAGHPAVLHSCGKPDEVMDDIINDMRFDGRHSYEDTIIPVEEAYDRWHDRIAIIGGMDLDFIIRSPEEEIVKRCTAMLDRASIDGGYALGTGNSVPEYIPQEKYLAIAKTALNWSGK